jgi:glycosyltransferase involved in cell wall biosynthesis
MSKKTFSVVIPLVPAHVQYLSKLIESLVNAKLPPDQIIIAASSQTQPSYSSLDELVSGFKASIQITSSESHFSAGINRNRGWELAETDYVTFCDADDTYAWDRISILEEIASADNADLILHNYTYLKPSQYIDFLPRTSALIRSEELYKATFPEGKRDISLETGVSGDTNIVLPKISGKRWKIHHGHASVKRNLHFRYGTKIRGEDGEFCRDILFAKKKVAYTPNKLSNYHRPTFLNVYSMSKNRVHAELAGVKIFLRSR